MDSKAVVAHEMLHMKMTAEEQRDVLPFQLLYQLLAVLNGTVIHIYLALLQKVVVGHGQKDDPVLIGCLQLSVNPFICFGLNHASHTVTRLILAGIQHQKPHGRTQVIGVTQGTGIPAVGLRVTEFLINPYEVRWRGGFCRVTVRTGIHGRAGVIDVMVAGNHHNGYPCPLQRIQLAGQFLMAFLFALKAQIPANNQHIRVQKLDFLKGCVRDLPHIVGQLTVPMLHHGLEHVTFICK